jgi:hypothetical protein
MLRFVPVPFFFFLSLPSHSLPSFFHLFCFSPSCSFLLPPIRPYPSCSFRPPPVLFFLLPVSSFSLVFLPVPSFSLLFLPYSCCSFLPPTVPSIFLLFLRSSSCSILISPVPPSPSFYFLFFPCFFPSPWVFLLLIRGPAFPIVRSFSVLLQYFQLLPHSIAPFSSFLFPTVQLYMIGSKVFMPVYFRPGCGRMNGRDSLWRIFGK